MIFDFSLADNLFAKLITESSDSQLFHIVRKEVPVNPLTRVSMQPIYHLLETHVGNWITPIEKVVFKWEGAERFADVIFLNTLPSQVTEGDWIFCASGYYTIIGIVEHSGHNELHTIRNQAGVNIVPVNTPFQSPNNLMCTANVTA